MSSFQKISVLVPTRKRTKRLCGVLNSFERTVVSRASAELVFRVDEDDIESQLILAETPWKVFVGPRLNGYASLPTFFNEMLTGMSGDVLMCGNDDMVFRTPDWPRLLLDEANKYPDGIFDLGVSTFNEVVYPFSVISKQAALTMGGIHDPRLFWGDVYLRDIMAAFDRSVIVRSVQIDHEWAGLTPDAVFTEANQHDPSHWSDEYWSLHRQIVAEKVALLRAAQAVAA